MAEATALLRRTSARLIAVLGERGAGKTCLLASMFLQIASGQYANLPYRFASSLSLHGWRDFIDRASAWEGDREREILAHTPVLDDADAGHFLHLGLRPSNPDDERHIDVLLTDLPGEQVSLWSLRGEKAAGIPYLQRADGFVIVLDAEALLSPKGAKLDSEIATLVRRVISATRPGPPRGIALVLSKADLIVDSLPTPPNDRTSREGWGPVGKRLRQTWPALANARERGFEVDLFATSAFPTSLAKGQPVNVVEPFAHVLTCCDRRIQWPRLVGPVPPGASPFQAMRRWEVA